MTAWNRLQEAARRHSSFVHWMVFVGLKDIIPNFYMYRADRLGMAHRSSSSSVLEQLVRPLAAQTGCGGRFFGG